ncbi:class I SAM-dependent methyltransferase [Microbacterium sp. Bi121]|uniref:class I SAM-dependent methyltransferase n=1 Tax=Microbacterium sp. Bi121 TaxID=2822348 RepID=UPI001E111004|nr:class I SAM-dependent methyltransferase [Microbacterium sp. Bi121]CAH0187891.1 putative S-adenosylmethionine-dependent methyltransferase MSMEG_2350/MSMEI_2290 [Microbacterium sp. Bi121]
MLAQPRDSDDVAIAAAYDSRAAEYIELAGSIDQMDASDRRLIAGWRDSTAGPLLDAGCGPGPWTDFLHDGSRDVIGVDLSEKFLASARRTYPHLRFEAGSFRTLPVADASLGGILAWYSLIHTAPAEVPDALDEFYRVLAPGGSLLLGFFDGPPREPFAHAVTRAYFWSAEALDALLAEVGFTVTHQEHRQRTAAEASTRPHAALTAIKRDS